MALSNIARTETDLRISEFAKQGIDEENQKLKQQLQILTQPSGPPSDYETAHRSHEPSFIHDGIPRYGKGDDSHDPAQHDTPVNDYNVPIPELTPTNPDIDRDNNMSSINNEMQIAGGDMMGISADQRRRNRILSDPKLFENLNKEEQIKIQGDTIRYYKLLEEA